MPPKPKNASSSQASQSNGREKNHRCTACTSKIKNTYDANLHPLISVLLCRKCYVGYGTGDFAKDFGDDGVDEKGDDNYCRWCCDGGELFGCMNDDKEDRCHYAFCKECIERNVPEDPILKYGDDENWKWYCYSCEPKKLSKLQKNATIAMKELNKKNISASVAAQSRTQLTELPFVESTTSTTKAQPTPNKTQQTPTKNQSTPNKTDLAAAKTQPTPPKVQPTTIKAVPDSTKTPATPIKVQLPPLKTQAEPSKVLSTNPKAQSTNSKAADTPKDQNTSVKAPTETSKTQPTAAKTLSDHSKTQPTASKIHSESSKSQPTATKAHSEQSKPRPAPATKVQPPKTQSTQGPTPTRTPQQATQPRPSSLPQAVTTGPAKLHVNGTTKSLTGVKGRESLSTITFKPSSNPRGIKRALTAAELEQRLDVYRKTKNIALEEIHTKFDNIVQMLLSKEPKRTLIDMEIDSLKKPFIDLQNMSNDMKKLNHS